MLVFDRFFCGQILRNEEETRPIREGTDKKLTKQESRDQIKIRKANTAQKDLNTIHLAAFQRDLGKLLKIGFRGSSAWLKGGLGHFDLKFRCWPPWNSSIL